MNKTLLILLYFLFSLQKVEAIDRYNWKYYTITHRLLQMEEQDCGLDESKKVYQFDLQYRILDKLFSECIVNIKSIQKSTSRAYAYLILRCIDSTLAKNGFFTRIPSYKLSGVLTEVEKEAPSTNIYINTTYRKNYYAAFSKVHYFDCDLSSIIYLGVSEAAGLPLSYIEVPRHGFIRWHFDDYSYLNWDTNYADTISDDTYRKGLGPTGNDAFNHLQELNCHYMESWDINRLIGYYYFVVGRSLKREKNLGRAKTYYEMSIKTCHNLFSNKHALAYLIVFADSVRTQTDIKHANELETELFLRNCYNDEVIETLACSFSLLGNKEMALVILRYHSNPDKELIHAIETNGDIITIYRKKHNVFN